MVVGDQKKKEQIAALYRQAFEGYRSMPVSAHALAENASGDDVAVMKGVVSSAEALAENLHRSPWLVIPCVEGRMPPMEGPMGSLAQASQYGSILPAFWSFMLAARARGLGTSWTTLHLLHEKEDILGIPFDGITQAALSPLAFTQGTDFKPAKNRNIEGVLHVDAW
jgi:nitroreductase